MMNNKMLTILKREYLTRVTSKGFIIGTVLGPVIMLSFALLPALFAMMTLGGVKQVYVFDQTGEYASAIINYVKPEEPKEKISAKTIRKSEDQIEKLAEESSSKMLSLINYTGGNNLTEFKKHMQDSIAKETIFGYLTIEANPDSSPKLTFYSNSTSDYVILSNIEKRANEIFRLKTLDRLGVSPLMAKEINKKIEMKTIKISETGESEDKGFGFIIAFVMGFIIYMSTFAYGSVVMQSAMEEKQSRIVEVIISSVKPFDLLMGKVLGIGLLALTQFTIWGIGAGIIGAYGAVMVSAMAGPGAGIGFTIPMFSIISFVIYFMLGYLIFSTIYAAIGASVDNMQDAQQLVMPISLIVIIPIMLISFVARDPNSTLSVITSLIPFFSPILMVARIATETPPLWQILLSFAIMIGTILVMVWAAAKIYRVGVLMYGKKITLGEIFKWLRY